MDQAGVLLGVIDITKIRHIIFRTELYQHFTVRQLMMQPAAVLTEHDSMDEVMQKFDKPMPPNCQWLMWQAYLRVTSAVLESIPCTGRL